MTEHLNEKLSLLLDGDLDAAERRAAEMHLVDCAECQALLEDFKQLRMDASRLEAVPPTRDLWAGIASRLVAEPGVVPLASRRRFAFSVPQLAAAAVALMMVSAGTAALVLRHGPAAPSQVGVGTIASLPGYVDSTLVVRVNAASTEGVATYDQAIRDIEVTLAQRRTRLDTSTVRVLEQSLTIIDRAILQARAALARDTNNLYLNTHLQNALDQKLDLLRHVATLPTVS